MDPSKMIPSKLLSEVVLSFIRHAYKTLFCTRCNEMMQLSEQIAPFRKSLTEHLAMFEVYALMHAASWTAWIGWKSARETARPDGRSPRRERMS